MLRVVRLFYSILSSHYKSADETAFIRLIGRQASFTIFVHSTEKGKKMIILKRKDFGTGLILFQLFYVLFYGAIRDYLDLPGAISYFIDILNIAVTAWLIFYKRALTEIFELRLQRVLGAVLLLTAVSLLTAILNHVRFLLVLWSCRNMLRYFPFFFATIIFWDRRAADIYSNALIWLQIPNAILCFFQFFIKNERGDEMGGIFGNVAGCNAFLCAFLFIVITLVVQKYLNGKANIIVMCASCFSAMVISAFAELKVSYLVIPLIIIASFMLNRPSLKTFILAAVITYGMVVAINLIVFYFPYWTDSFSSLKAFLHLGKETGGGYYISRLGAFSEINEYFFKNSIVRNLIGYGFGNCEYSSFDFLTSEFFERYGVINYRWFSHMMWFLQTGYLGIICCAAFIVTSFFWITNMKLRFGDAGGIGSFGQIMCGVIIISFAYNCSMTIEAGYLMFAALAVPFVYYKEFLYKRKKVKQQRSVPAKTRQNESESDLFQLH